MTYTFEAILNNTMIPVLLFELSNDRSFGNVLHGESYNLALRNAVVANNKVYIALDEKLKCSLINNGSELFEWFFEKVELVHHKRLEDNKCISLLNYLIEHKNRSLMEEEIFL